MIIVHDIALVRDFSRIYFEPTTPTPCSNLFVRSVTPDWYFIFLVRILYLFVGYFFVKVFRHFPFLHRWKRLTQITNHKGSWTVIVKNKEENKRNVPSILNCSPFCFFYRNVEWKFNRFSVSTNVLHERISTFSGFFYENEVWKIWCGTHSTFSYRTL